MGKLKMQILLYRTFSCEIESLVRNFNELSANPNLEYGYFYILVLQVNKKLNLINVCIQFHPISNIDYLTFFRVKIGTNQEIF